MLDSTVESEQKRRYAPRARPSPSRLRPIMRELRRLPNQFTVARLVLVFVLWGFALAGDSFTVGVGLGIAFLTDVADGFAARRLNQVTQFGSKLDSLVDGLVAPSAIAWLLMLEPDVVRDHIFLAGIWVAVTYASLAVGLLRHRRFANLHLRSSRIACVAQYAFLVDVFIADGYSPMLMYLAAGFGILSSTETLLLQLAFDRVDEKERSFGRAVKRRRAAA
jgi:CDP-diacylglycerol--glycerol-3-phosphate 3-phosphatidyltransferase